MARDSKKLSIESPEGIKIVNRIDNWKFIAPCLVFLIGAIAFRAFFLDLEKQQLKNLNADFKLNSSRNSLLLKGEMSENLKQLQSFAAFFSASSRVSPTEFKTFTKRIIDNTKVLAYCWHNSEGVLEAMVSTGIRTNICSNFSILEPNKIFTHPFPSIMLSTYVSTNSQQAGYISAVIGFKTLASVISHFDYSLNSLILADMGTNIFLKYNLDEDMMLPLLPSNQDSFFEVKSFNIADFSDVKFIYHAQLEKKEFEIQKNSFFIMILIFLVTLLLALFCYLIISRNRKVEIEVKAKTQELRAEVENSNRLASVKSQFLANMSHEIRTPLNGVLGMLSLIKMNELKAENSELVKSAKSAGHMLLRILNDILDVSKMESIKFNLEVERIKLSEVIAEAEEIVRADILTKELKYYADYSELTGLIFEGDSVRIKQIVLNLLSNAVKFTSKGEISLRVMAKKMTNEESLITVTVSDSGIGISKDGMNSLFENFSQADSSITRKFGGTGLGLVICKKLSQLMGGDIIAHSEEGIGSTFISTFKLKNITNSSTKYLKHEEKELVFKNTYSVLVVEDNLLNQKVIIKMLKKLGLKATLAQNGREALDIIESGNQFDLIFMDIQMPIMDGLEASSRIQKFLKGKTPPIVAITANTFEEDQCKFKALGISNYLSKPISLASLSNTLNELLD